MEGKIGNKRRA